MQFVRKCGTEIGQNKNCCQSCVWGKKHLVPIDGQSTVYL